MARISSLMVSVFFLCTLSVSFSVSASHLLSDRPSCTAQVLQTIEMFNCIARGDTPAVEFGSASSYFDEHARDYFPSEWPQLGYDQQHRTLFNIDMNDRDAPAYLRNGVFWAAPLTGIEYLRIADSAEGMNNNEAWGSRAAQYLGNVMGVSVAKGIVIVQMGKHEIWALDVATGKAIWKNDVTTAAGMGQAVIADIDDEIIVFAPVGDAAISIDDAVDFSNGKSHDRGGSFSGLYAFDGLTGELLWFFATKGASRPTPVYREGLLYLATSGGKFFVIDADSGKLKGEFSNPGDGIPGLASLNWFETPDEQILLIYGTSRPRRILAVDATDPKAPKLAWSYTPPGATANSAGDTPVAVDANSGVVFTTVISKLAGKVSMNMLALNASNGALMWSNLAGGVDLPPGYKGSVPMIYDGVVYTGNTSNGHVLAYNILSGALIWEFDLAEPDDLPGIIHRPRAAPVIYQNKLILVEGRDIHTFDAKTGEQLNLFETNGNFSRWGINQPVILGNLMLLSSVSGWVFAAPVDTITRSPGFPDNDNDAIPVTDMPLLAKLPEFSDPSKLPSAVEAEEFPETWLAFNGGQKHNGVIAGTVSVHWESELTAALSLDDSPIDEDLLGTDAAIQKLNAYLGAGSGVSTANGIAYVGSNRFNIHALNAFTGEKIWTYKTLNANGGQPIVTPNTVIVSGGDKWMNLGSSGKFRARSPSTFIGDSFPTIIGLDPQTGIEKWTLYSSLGTSIMTPLYHAGNLYWVNGESKVWAINADTGEQVPEYFGENNQPIMNLGGFNVLSSANKYRDSTGRDLMLVGTAMPNNVWAIDLETASVVWKNALAEINTTIKGFATVSPAVNQDQGLLISSVLADEDLQNSSVDVVAYALNADTGELVWKRSLGRGAIPSGFAAPSALLDDNKVYLHNPLTQTALALNSLSGEVVWTATVPAPKHKYSWGSGVISKGQLLLPVGPSLYTIDIDSGDVQSHYDVGGSMTYNSPTVVGNTLYIGNAWGVVSAIPLDELIP